MIGLFYENHALEFDSGILDFLYACSGETLTELLTEDFHNFGCSLALLWLIFWKYREKRESPYTQKPVCGMRTND